MTAVLLLAGIGGWGGFASIEGAILASGHIEAQRNRVIIQHPEGGRVVELLVQDGEGVEPGDPILRLDGGLMQIEREIVEGQYIEALARAARLTAERDDTPDMAIPAVLPDPGPAALIGAPQTQQSGADRPGDSGSAQPVQPSGAHSDHAERVAGQQRLLAARRDGLQRQIAQLQQRRDQAGLQQTGLHAQITALEAEARLVAADLAQQELLLAGGLAPLARVMPLRREAARLGGALGAARAESAAVAGRMTEIDMQIDSLLATRREEAETGLRDLGVTIPELAARRRALDDRLQSLILRAPAGGRIHALSIGGSGAVLRPAEPVAEIVPSTDTARIVVRIRPDDRDRVQPGQATRILLPRAGGRDRHEFVGRITALSADTLEDPRTGERYFSADVALDPDGLSLLDDRALLPGLPIEAQITTGARSPLSWVLAPISVYLNRALRED